MWKCKLICCISIIYAGATALCSTSPVKPVYHQPNRIGNDYNHLYHYLHKRQIDPQSQSLPFEPQFFQQPFDENTNDPFNQPVQLIPDEETRFFSSGDEATTLNPLSFYNTQTTTTTQNPIEQQRLNEQRRFQEEIANRALREQQSRDLGLITTQSPPPPPNVNDNLLAQQNQPFFQDVDRGRLDFLPSPEFSPFVQADSQLFNNEENYRFTNEQT